jgi:hypothetical protein
MAWIMVAMVLWVALLAAHLVELHRITTERSRRAAITRSQVNECLANIDHVIDLRGQDRVRSTDGLVSPAIVG